MVNFLYDDEPEHPLYAHLHERMMAQWNRERREQMGTYDPIAAKRARLEREIRRAQTELDALELVPTEDVYADGAIIRAEILNPGKREPFTYVFLKVVNPDAPGGPTTRWYHTGWIQHNPHTGRGNAYQLTYFQGWSELQKWMAESGRVVETWTVMSPQRGMFPVDAEASPSARTKDYTKGAY